MPNAQRFQEKLWDLANTCKSGSVHWNKTGDAIVFEFAQFKKEFLDQRDTFCKSNKLASFIRQLNLYGFKKSIGYKKSRKRDVHEFKHPWFARDREDWLPSVVRNAILPKTTAIKGTARSKSMRKKKSKNNQENKEPRTVKRRGRPRKSEQLIKIKSDHSYEKKDTCCSENKANGPCLLPSFKNTPSPRKNGGEHFFNGWSRVSFGLSKGVQYPDPQYTPFSCTQPKFPEEAKKMECISNDYVQHKEEFLQFQERKPALPNFHDSYQNPLYTNIQHTSQVRALQSLENISPIPRKIAPLTRPIKQYIWDGNKLESLTKMNSEESFQPQQNLKVVLSEPESLSSVRPEKISYAMSATMDKNQHVMFKINEPHLMNGPKKTLDTTSSNKENKLQLPNRQIKEQFISTGEMGHLNYVYPTKIVTSNITESVGVVSPLFTNASGCYVTKEFLDIREAYFRHYPERRPSVDGPDLRIYRRL